MDLKDPTSKVFLYKVRMDVNTEGLICCLCADVVKKTKKLSRPPGRRHGSIQFRGEREHEAQFETSGQEVCLHN